MRFLLGGIARALVRGPRGYGDFLFGEMKRIAVPQDASNYAVWLEFYDTPGLARDEEAAKVLKSLVDQPLVSVLVPVYNTPERWLRRCIERVRAQIYPALELFIADDASTPPHIARLLADYASLDSRISYVVSDNNEGA